MIPTKHNLNRLNHLNQEERKRIIQKLNESCLQTMIEHLGILFTEIDSDGGLWATMPVDHRTIRPMGILHGGAMCTLAETVGSVAANLYLLGEEGIQGAAGDGENKVTVHPPVVGIEIQSNHLKSVTAPGVVSGVARPIHVGRTLQLWDIAIFNTKQELINSTRLSTFQRV